MSGIVGIIQTDGTPVDRPLLERMTAWLAFRGPDAQAVRVDGHVGLGHTLLRTTDESASEAQPLTVDGQIWIVADARIDSRRELVRKLAPCVDRPLHGVPDVNLILHAYDVWGERCVEHLVGDFAFAIWDGRRRALFCARDHFGVRPLFYAHADGSLLFSNTLECLRLCPAVSTRPNDQAIGDFLMFGSNKDAATTTFADIGRLPPAHCLRWVVGGTSPDVRRYWTLPTDGRVHYRRPEQYVEHFRDVFRDAVTDRLRTPNVSVLMSGGLDSTAVTAVAREADEKTGGTNLKAFTTVMDRLVPHEERRFAGLVADRLRIPIEYLPAEHYRLYERNDEPGIRSPEPAVNPFGALFADRMSSAAAWGRVVLTGQGGDPCFYGPAEPLQTPRWLRVVADVGRFSLRHRMLPTMGIKAGVTRRLRPRIGVGKHTVPAWINAEFARRQSLHERWEFLARPVSPVHPTHPEGYRALIDPIWVTYHEMFDAGRTRLPLEARHPFFDRRVIEYVLSIPVVPWCLAKSLLRSAMEAKLPDEVRRRKKAPMLSSPVRPRFQEACAEWGIASGRETLLRRYVDVDAVARSMAASAEGSTFCLYRDMQPLGLAFWLQMVSRGLQSGG